MYEVVGFSSRNTLTLFGTKKHADKLMDNSTNMTGSLHVHLLKHSLVYSLQWLYFNAKKTVQ